MNSVAGELQHILTIILSIVTLKTRLHRASWVQTELLLTFPPPVVGCVSLIPRNSDETAGRFRVWLSVGSQPPHLLWDRKVEGGFPELKVLVSTHGTLEDALITGFGT